MQLLNPHKDDIIISFSDELVELVQALASQASVALTNQLLIDEQKKLFRSFIKLVIDALDGVTEQDQRLAGRVEQEGRACLIVVN